MPREKPAGRHTQAAIGTPAVGRVAEALDTFCGEERLPQEVAWRLRVALDEVLANVVAYARPPGGGGTLDVWFRRDGAVVEITIEDDGLPFDPLARPNPNVDLPLDARQPGGLGIALVKSLMDEVSYHRTTRNVLTLRKRIDTAASIGGTDTNADSPH